MKDSKGHGSDARGGGSYSNIDKNMRGAGKHVGYGGGDTFHIQKSNGSGSNWYSAVGQRSGQVVSGRGLGAISSRLSSLPQDGAAKAELARGNPKAADAPIHPGASGRVSSTVHETIRDSAPGSWSSNPANPRNSTNMDLAAKYRQGK